jgi:hypothetical protein
MVVIDAAGPVGPVFRHALGPGTAAVRASLAALFGDAARRALSER